MIVSFTKMNGAGNDFVVLDNRDLTYNLSKEQIARLCDRHRGIGADGLLAAEPAESDADFRFRYYNADGGEAEMCGNGARCFGRFTASLLAEETDEVSFETIAGRLSAKLIDDQVEVAMSDPFDLTLDLPIAIEGLAHVHSVNTGVPHTVSFVDNLAELDVRRLGATLRYHEHFAPAGTNANFAQVLSPGHIAIRTYERGVEDETLACGTGMVASAIYHHLLTGAPSPIKVDVKGGETLEIGFEKDGDHFRKVTLTGPAEITFTGEVEI
ncbi:diaminopimelate epimerase [Roseibacillus ishigakijimensis]|uniref:Diaminopimelate epimerase n=1 Tax=Roseibacillus ishigakijimensis TaxID=454146 RepID=A0A934VHW2_9BACT|nr:diaminopimelate epimerase [Roseibacillus ishigakijimensis]MBK1834408.1 diaminopimelate epimerase [Roseibacillus ishigakijimensis]